jgi:hypothetical protein
MDSIDMKSLWIELFERFFHKYTVGSHTSHMGLTVEEVLYVYTKYAVNHGKYAR